jgi:hypothetical protein
MRTISTIASISLLTLVALGTPVEAAAGQGDKVSRPPSELLRRLPSTPEAVQKAADKVVPAPAASRPNLGTTAPKPILQNQPPRVSTEAVNGARHVRFVQQPQGAPMVLGGLSSGTNAARATSARPSVPAAGTTPYSSAPAKVSRTTASTAAPAPRPITRSGTTAGSATTGPRPSTRPGTTAGSATTVKPGPALKPMASSAAGTGSGIARGAAGVGRSVVVYGAVEVVRQEIETPGKTKRDLSTGNINPDRNGLAGAVAGGAASAGAVALGAATLPALAVGATTAGGLAIVDQESRDPGKTVRDINRAARDAERAVQEATRAVGGVIGGLFGR